MATPRELLDRAPPQAVPLERSLVGSMLLDPGCIDDVLLVVGADDFYDDACREVFVTLLAMHHADKKTGDIAIVVKHLRERGVYDGKPVNAAALAEIVHAPPHAGHVSYYAREVREKSIYRHTIDYATDLIRRCYTEEGEADAILAEAESKVFHLRDRTVTEAESMTDVMRGVLAEIDERLCGKRSGTVRTGFADFDSLLSGGLRNGELIVIAGRPSMGKSAFVANLADAAAVEHGVPTLIVSLEMSNLATVERMLFSRSRVSSYRGRSGALNSDDRAAIVDAAAEFSGAQVFLEDDPSMDVRRLAAVCRRMKRKKNLGLVVVDYLQLMQPVDAKINRQEQVAAISKGLKAIAKQIDVPVVCAAQLNRQVDTRTNTEPRLSDLRECVIATTKLVDADTGRLVVIADVKPGMRILGATPTLRVASGLVESVWETGKKKVFAVTTKTGREVVATGNHPLLTSRGWVRLDELDESDQIAVAFRLPAHGKQLLDRNDRCRLLGYLAGNGSVQHHRTIGIIIPDAEAFGDACEIVRRHWPECEIRVKPGEYNDAWISRTYDNGWGKPHGNPLREWLREIGVIGSRDDTKAVPSFVFESGTEGAAEFLAGYLETDGCVTRTQTGRWSARFDTTSLRLAHDVAHLLSRLGIASTVSPGARSALATRDIYRVSIAGAAANLRRFGDVVPAKGVRGRKLAAMAIELEGTKTRANLLSLPREAASYAAAVSNYRDQGRRISRERCTAILEKTDDPVLRAWNESDFVWDGIRSVKPRGVQEVYDIRIAGIHSFLANGVAVHNSGAIEQDADVVMLLHRPEYYHATEDNKGRAIAIVAKQRSGPTGKVNLVWRGEYTRFETAATSGQEIESGTATREEHARFF